MKVRSGDFALTRLVYLDTGQPPASRNANYLDNHDYVVDSRDISTEF